MNKNLSTNKKVWKDQGLLIFKLEWLTRRQVWFIFLQSNVKGHALTKEIRIGNGHIFALKYKTTFDLSDFDLWDRNVRFTRDT